MSFFGFRLEFLRGTTPWLCDLSIEASLCEWVAWTFVALRGCAGRGGVSVCSVWPASGFGCFGRMWVRVVCAMSGGAGSWFFSDCAGAVVCVSGAPCGSASGVVGRPGCVPEEFASSVGAVARAAGADAVRWDPPKIAGRGHPGSPRARGAARSESSARVVASGWSVARIL